MAGRKGRTPWLISRRERSIATGSANRDPADRERSKTFDRLSEARRFKAVVEDEMGRGLWVDPRSGKTLLKEFSVLME